MGKIQHKCLPPNDETMTIRTLVMGIAFFYEYYHNLCRFSITADSPFFT
jgi:hypothetical protein